MSKLFKTTLVAAAIAGMSSVATAGTLTTTTVNYSAQGAAIAGATDVETVSFSHTVNAGFAVNDLITYSLPAGTVDSKAFNWQSTINFSTAGSGGATMTATLLSTNADETEATYRVTTVTATGTQTTIGASTPANHIVVNLLDSALGADVTVSVASVLSNGITPIDAGTKAITLVDSKDQFGDVAVATSADLDATISVAKARKGFTSGTTDVFTWTSTNDTTLTDAVTVTKQVMTLAGDFDGFVKGDFTTGGASTVALAEDSQSVTFTYASAMTTDTVTITPPVDSKTTTAVVLEAQDFEVSGVSSFGTGSTESLSSADAGSWGLDGAVVTVPYMPYGANVSQILYVTNAGMLDADISVTAFDDAGNSYDLGVIGQASKGAVTKIAGLVRDGLEAAGFTGGKVSLTITVNAEDKDVSVYSAYNVGGADRGNVLNSQYKGK